MKLYLDGNYYVLKPKRTHNIKGFLCWFVVRRDKGKTLLLFSRAKQSVNAHLLDYNYSFAELSCSNLNIQTDQKGSVEIEGLTEIPISDFKKASWLYNKGKRVRSTSWTNVNEASSRSHWWVLHV